MKLTNQHTLILILLTGAVLRFWDYTSIPFTHDEFSAFFRIGFTDFGELIEKGVIVDTHPPGVQVFMNYWALLFGDSPWIIKLPFTLMGLGAIVLVWKIGKLWYNETVAIISASFMACLQFPIMYSQIARPYISGLFLTLLMAWYWSRLIKKPDEKFWKNGMFFILAGALCAYNHHFSLLFAAIIGFSGLFMLPKKHFWKYAALGLGIFLLYMPNLSLFLTQLEHGGVGEWLAAPKNDFLWMFIRYIFHFSWLLLGVATLLFIASLFFKTKTFCWKKFLLFFSWFMVPFLIGFFYSRYRNPVIQYSVLIFSFPYLFFILYGTMANLKPKWNALITISIVTLSITTLTTERDHYKIFYNSPYRAILVDQNEAFKIDSSALRIVDSGPKMNKYYNEHLDIDTNYVHAENHKYELEFRNLITDNFNSSEKLFFGGYSQTNSSYLSIIKEYYPTEESAHNFEGGSSYVFNKTPRNNSLQKQFLLSGKADLSNNQNSPDSIAGFRLNKTYSTSYNILLDTLKMENYDYLEFHVQINLPDSSSKVVLVTDISKDGKVLHWSGTNVKKFISSNKEWYTAHHIIPMMAIKEDLEGAVLKTYLYNISKSLLYYDDLKVEIRKGNPVIYGLYNPLYE